MCLSDKTDLGMVFRYLFQRLDRSILQSTIESTLLSWRKNVRRWDLFNEISGLFLLATPFTLFEIDSLDAVEAGTWDACGGVNLTASIDRDSCARDAKAQAKRALGDVET